MTHYQGGIFTKIQLKGGKAIAGKMKNHQFSVKDILLHIGLVGLLLCGTAYIYGGFVPVAGLIMGLLTGVVYFFHLYYQIERLIILPKEKAPSYIRWGWMARFGLLIVVLVFLGYRLNIGYSAFITGFFTMPAILFLNAIGLIGQQIAESRKNHKKAGGSKPWGMVGRKSGDISW